MAKVYIERAYIEPYNEDEESCQILIHIKDDSNHVYAGKVEITHDIAWIHMDNAENGDLMINNSAGMEANKWNHITKEILGL
jgi:hypothetical protein